MCIAYSNQDAWIRVILDSQVISSSKMVILWFKGLWVVIIVILDMCDFGYYLGQKSSKKAIL